MERSTPEVVCWVGQAKATIDTDHGLQMHRLDLGPLLVKLAIDEKTDIQSLKEAFSEIWQALTAEQNRRYKERTKGA